MPKATSGFNPREIKYELFDPKRHRDVQEAIEERVTHLQAFHHLGDEDIIEVHGFTPFSALVQRGWPAISYRSHVVETPDHEQLYYWMTDHHAEMIGKALRPSVKRLTLELTCLEHDGFAVMAAATSSDVRILDLYTIHRSGDEVTLVEARGIAQLATKLGTRALHVWAGEYEAGALDQMADELERLGNATLTEIDICDTSKPEPQDRIDHPALARLAKRNRVAAKGAKKPR